MPAVNFYFQVHQPFRLHKYSFFGIGRDPYYEDSEINQAIMRKVADKCYLPMNAVLLEQIKKHAGNFKVSFSISGTAIDQFEQYAPEVLESFKELVATGCVEIINETHNHSLCFLYSLSEFKDQINWHKKRIEEIFGVKPTAFRNTELIYNNSVARVIEEMGYDAILAEGADHVLGWRSPTYVYSPMGCKHLKLLLKHYRLSDDIAFRFSNKNWPEYPLSAEKYASWVHLVTGKNEVVNLFMDYETFGEHQWSDTGIFAFMAALPGAILANKRFKFVTPSEIAASHESVSELDIPSFTSWADAERDLSAWLGNDMQQDAMESVYRLEKKARAVDDKIMLRTWRRFQTSDHFYYMATKFFADGDVHKYFNPHSTPYDAYITFMNAIADFELRLDDILKKRDAAVKTVKIPAAPQKSKRDKTKDGSTDKPSKTSTASASKSASGSKKSAGAKSSAAGEAKVTKSSSKTTSSKAAKTEKKLENPLEVQESNPSDVAQSSTVQASAKTARAAEASVKKPVKKAEKNKAEPKKAVAKKAEVKDPAQKPAKKTAKTADEKNKKKDAKK